MEWINLALASDILVALGIGILGAYTIYYGLEWTFYHTPKLFTFLLCIILGMTVLMCLFGLPLMLLLLILFRT